MWVFLESIADPVLRLSWPPGELPLSLAACTNQLEVVRYLVNNPYQQARLTEQDSLGNSVLHALIMVANDTEKNTELVIEMYDQILMVGSQVNPTWHLEEIVNRQGLTPLKLAAKTGKVEVNPWESLLCIGGF